MSRRPPNPAAERAAQNTQTIKSLLKLEGNKTCADCKRNKRRLHRGHILTRDAPVLMGLFARSKMGELELGHLCLHTMFRHPSRDGNTYQQGQVCRSGRLDRRAITKCLKMGELESEQVLGSKVGGGPCALGSKD
jgi:hypothetical protein